MISALLLVLASVASLTQAQDSYAPYLVQCPPSQNLLRLAGTNPQGNQTLSPSEQAYIQGRKAVAEPLWQQYLSGRNIGYDASAFTNASSWPTLGMAISGGGYRAALYGAGTLSGFDSRNTTSASVGTGGLLQLATYLTGLSGGSWMVSSLAIHDMPTLTELVLGGSTAPGWQLQYNLLTPGGILGVFDNNDYYDNLQADVDLKEQAGFNTSITDIWGRALSYHFAPGTVGEDSFYQRPNTSSHGAALQFGDITSRSNFVNHNMPFPIIVADSVLDNQSIQGNPLSTNLVLLNQTVFEFNPYEFGSYDNFLSAFVNLTYLGTELNLGTPLNSTACVNNFDNFGFLIGTSSSLFNAILAGINGPVDGAFSAALQAILNRLTEDLQQDDNSLANYPNPFQGINPGQFARADSPQLNLVDGGENGENVPLGPLLVRARGVDIIFAIDGSADTDQNWPNGTSLINTYNRTRLPDIVESVGFPSVPLNSDVWVNAGLNTRPTVFGCDGNSTSEYPLVLYLPNAPLPGVSPTTNTATLKLDYELEEAASFLDQAQQNVFKGMVSNTSAAGTRDQNWPNCLACIVMDRSRERAGIARSSTCETCFNSYCYNAAQAQADAAANTAKSSASTLTLSSLLVLFASAAAFVLL